MCSSQGKPATLISTNILECGYFDCEITIVFLAWHKWNCELSWWWHDDIITIVFRYGTSVLAKWSLTSRVTLVPWRLYNFTQKNSSWQAQVLTGQQSFGTLRDLHWCLKLPLKQMEFDAFDFILREKHSSVEHRTHSGWERRKGRGGEG